MQLQTVGEIVHVLRSRLGLEQVELARACGWQDASAVSRIEKSHVHPTRRTLQKLAENLADPVMTGTPGQVRAWLFLAAGILPTPREVDELSARMPDIETLPHPASVFDFGWYVWRANELFRKGVGLPEKHIGRNYIELFFERNGSIRKQLGDLWGSLAPVLIGQFRKDTADRTEQRWFGRLLGTLRTLPDFEEMWGEPTSDDMSALGWSHTSVNGGMVGAVRSQLPADPRLIVGHIVPEDPDGRHELLKLGALR
jgi:transcriptional regulator with XRE-family HTH domain